MMKKLTKFGRSTLSIILCLTMLLTTFCFFDIGSVISNAMVTVTENNKMKGSLSSQFMYAPEIAYLKPGSSAFQYFSNYDPVTGKAISTNDATSRLEFDYKGATEIAIGVNRVYYKNGENDVDFSGTLKINNVTVTQNKVAYNATTSTSFSSIASSTSGAISVTLNASQCSLTGAATGTTYYIQWVFRYKVDGAYHFAFMYTGVYVPLLDQAGTSTSQRYIASGSNPTENHSWSFITGAMKYSGGNRKSQFLGTTANTLMAAPLVSFVGRAQNENNYTIPCGDGQALNENNFSSSQTPYNTFVYNRPTRGQNELYYDTTSISVPSSYSGNVAGNVSITNTGDGVIGSGITLGMAYIVVDTSRYSNYNQIPYLSAGYAQFYHDQDGNGNKLNSIKSVKRYNKGSSTSIAYDGTIYCDVDTSNYKDHDSYSVARGLYKFNGSIIDGLVTFDTWFFNGYKHFLGYTESIGVHHYNGLYTETVNKQEFRTVYNDAAHSHIDYKTYSSGYSAYYTELKSVAETLCNPQLYSKKTTSLSGTASGSVKAIETSIVNSTTTTDNYVYFYVPEVIYLTPGKTTFQYYSDMSSVTVSDGVCTATLNNLRNDATGNIYFYYKNASKVKITQSGASSVSLSGGNVTSFNSYVNTSQSAVTTANISGGSVSSAASTYITWTATYVEDNIEKTVTAQTRVYSPYLSPFVAAAKQRTKPRLQSANFCDSFAYISGVHDITPMSGTNRYPSAENLIPLLGKIKEPVNGQHVAPDGVWVDESSSDYAKGSSYYGDNTTSSHTYVSHAGTGTIYVDVSRFSNLSQVPNLTFGFGITDVEDSSGPNYFVADYTGISVNGNGKKDENAEWNRTPKKYLWNEDKNGTSGEGMKYEDDIIPGLDDLTKADGTDNLQIGALTDAWRGGRRAQNALFLHLDVVRTDKTGIRKAIEYANKYSYALQEDYFNTSSSEWLTYKTKLAAAQDALVKVDGRTADFDSKVGYGVFPEGNVAGSGLAKTLKDAVDVLLNSNRGTAPRNTSNYTATQKNVGLVANSNGTFTVAAISEAASEGTASISKTFKAYDKVEFSAEQYEGYKYVGYIKDGASSNGDAFSATDYNNMVNSSDPVSKSKNETLTFGNAKNVDYSYTFYYLVNPDVLFDNEFDFDSWASGILSTKAGTYGGTAAFDFATNSYTITSNGTQVQPRFLGDQGGLSYLGHRVDTKTSLIPGHKYRISYSVIGTADTTAHVAVFMFSTTSATDYGVTGEIGASTSIKANVKTSYSAELTVKEGYTYPTFRFGIYGGSSNVPSGVSLTYSDIYLQDITTPGGFKDDVTDATPHAVLGLIPGSQIGTMSSISRTGYAFDGWYNNQDSTGNGTGTKYTSTSTVGNSNLRLYAKWTVAPELMFDNEFVFDTWSNNASFGSGDIKVDKGSNLVYLYNKTTSLDTSTGPYDGTSAYKIAVTPGHTYRIRMNVTMGATAGSVDFMAFAFNNDGVSTPVAGNSTAYRRRPTISLAANQTGTLQTKPASETNNSDEQDFVMPADAKYLTIRFGIRSANTSATFSDIYIQDITSPAGKADDVSTADPINKVKLPGETVGSLADIERTGYTFTGWNTAKNGTGTTYTESTKMPSSNTQLWSQWEVNKYKVTYDYATNGGTSATKTTDNVAYGAAVDLTPTATKSGWTFVGWNTNKDATTALTSLKMPANDITLYAIYKKTLTVNFYSGYNKASNRPQSVTIWNRATSGSVTTPSADAYSGWNYLGWVTSTAAASATTVANGKSVSVNVTSGPFNYYALYSQTQTLSYNANGGSGAPSTQSGTAYYNSNGDQKNITSTIPTTPVPTRTGYTFAAWNTKADGSGTDYAVGKSYTNSKQNDTLYAKWTRNSYKVTYDYATNGGTSATKTSATVAYEGAVDLTPTATKSGWTFVGWNTNKDATTALTSLKMPANDITLYAIYKKTLTVNFYSGYNKASNRPQSVTIWNRATSGSVTTPSADAYSGWNYLGWVTSTAAASATTVANGKSVSVNVTSGPFNYYALYSQTQTLSYDANGGSGVPSTQSGTAYYNSNGDQTNITSTIPATPVPTRTGYTFSAWNTKADGSGTDYAVGKSYTNSKQNDTLYAKWTRNSYKVTYDYATNGGTSATKTSATVAYEGAVDLTPTATKSGWTFVGWNTNKDATTALTSLKMPANDITLYAIYKKTLTVNFYSGYNKASNRPQSVTIWNRATSGSVTTPSADAYSGWNYLGWVTSTAAASATTVANGKSVSVNVTSGPFNYYALYSQTQTLSYNANGGSGAPSTQSGTAYYNSNGDQKNITSTIPTTPVPTRTGYTFVAWNTKADGSGTNYAVGKSYTNSKQNDTLYAHWTTREYTITYIPNGGSVTPTSDTFTIESAINLPTPKREGYIFDGWMVTKAEGSWVKDTLYTGAKIDAGNYGNVTVTAQWSKIVNVYFYSGENKATVYTIPLTFKNGETTKQITTPTSAVAIQSWKWCDSWITEDAAKNNLTETTVTGAIKKGTEITINVNNGPFAYYAIYTQTQTLKYNSNATGDKTVKNIPSPTNGTAYYSSFTSLDKATNVTHDIPSTVPTRSGYTFSEWNKNSDGTGAGYAAGGKYTNENQTDTLYALWTKNKYTITYDDGVNKTPKDYDIETEITIIAAPTRDGYLFVGWKVATVEKDSGWESGKLYNAGEKIGSGMFGNVTIVAQWVYVKQAETWNEKFEEYNGKNSIDITIGVDDKGNEKVEKRTVYDEASFAKYKEAVDNYRKAKNSFVKNNSVIDVNSSDYATMLEAFKKATDELANTSLTEKKVVTDYLNHFFIDKTQHSLNEMNLNHYKLEILDKAKQALDGGNAIANGNYNITATDSTGTSYQAKLNSFVLEMAKAFKNTDTVKKTGPAFKVYESVASIKNDDKLKTLAGATAVNYVHTKKGATYYCYTNSTNPVFLITVDDIAGGAENRVCYPTSANEVIEPVFSGSANTTVKAYSKLTIPATNAANYYSTYTNKQIGTKYDYTQKQVIKLTPVFDGSSNGKVTYEFTATDDAFIPNVATQSALSSGKGNANNFSENLTTYTKSDSTTSKKITIVVDYHVAEEIKDKNGNVTDYKKLDVTGDQVENDKWLNQYHLFRQSGGASNWELPKTGDKAYTVNDKSYGQTDRGSFTFTYELGKTELGGEKINTTDANELVKLFNNEAKYNEAKKLTFVGTNRITDKSSAEEKANAGLGYIAWGNNWSFNYYPKSQSYTYVHLVDRWGNVADKVFYVGNQDIKAVSVATASTDGSYTILEDGGSGIATLSLNAANVEILTDENSTIENNVYKTTGNVIRIKTGEANKSYTLSMKDKATNASTAALKSDENGIITLNVEDTAHKSGVYTFTLNGMEINLYDNVENDKYIVKVYDGEAEEGEAAELRVVTTGEVGKVRFTDTDGNTITVAASEKNDDGTKTWSMTKSKPAGEYEYSISVKVGYEWITENSKVKLTFTEKILDSGLIRSAEYDAESGLYKITIEGRATKIQFISEDGMTRTYTRYHDSVKSRKTYDEDGNEVNDTARTLDHEIWLVDAKIYSGQKYTVMGKFEAGWNREGTATLTAH